MARILSPTNFLLLFIAFLWGVGFAPQRLALDGLAPVAFNFWRFACGAICILVCIFFLKTPLSKLLKLKTMWTGVALGALLFCGAALQQVSLAYTKVANVAFITGFYVVLVPLIGIGFKKRYPLLTWLGGVIAFIGLAMMSGFDGAFNYLGDGFALVGAIFWAIHLWAITFWVGRHHVLCLAFYQFLCCALLSLIVSHLFENTILSSTNTAYIWAVLSGVFVVALAYTLQVLALKKADPFVAAIIFSLESVFGAIVGYLVFTETLGLIGIIGAVLMFIGFVLAQFHEKQSCEK